MICPRICLALVALALALGGKQTMQLLPTCNYDLLWMLCLLPLRLSYHLDVLSGDSHEIVLFHCTVFRVTEVWTLVCLQHSPFRSVVHLALVLKHAHLFADGSCCVNPCLSRWQSNIDGL